ncbi:MAG TPA: queuosine precursor transporter [Polyangia bacterium]|nr:queuosine precursor transporter [Polyangia bacterium]
MLDARQKLYLYLCGVFLTALLIGDTIGSKLFTLDIPLGVTTLHATLSVGAIWFPITFLLTDVINEFYGSRGARFVTFLGFWMALFAFAVLLVARKIPAASFSPIPQDTFENVFGNANRIFFASLIAYLVGQLVDISVFQLAKRMTQSKHIWLRSTGSTLISQLIDTLLVTYIAFLGKLTPAQLRQAAVTSYAVKVILAIGLTPVIYAMHGFIHRRIGLEEAPADVERVHDAVG